MPHSLTRAAAAALAPVLAAGLTSVCADRAVGAVATTLPAEYRYDEGPGEVGRTVDAASSAVDATRRLDRAGLPSEDRSFALLQRLAPDQHRIRRSMAAVGCDTAAVVERAVPALDRGDGDWIATALNVDPPLDGDRFFTNFLTS